MSDRLHTWLIIGVSLLVLLGGLAMLDTLVSLKYEVGTAPCVSAVSGRDLCAAYERLKWLTGAAGGTVVALIGFSKQLIRKK